MRSTLSSSQLWIRHLLCPLLSIGTADQQVSLATPSPLLTPSNHLPAYLYSQWQPQQLLQVQIHARGASHSPGVCHMVTSSLFHTHRRQPPPTHHTPFLHTSPHTCPAKHFDPSSRARGRCAYFRTAPPPDKVSVEELLDPTIQQLVYPEVSDGAYGIPHIQAKPSLGVSMSGGGFRATTCASGWLRGLHNVSVERDTVCRTLGTTTQQAATLKWNSAH